jgi:hypothetical protein
VAAVAVALATSALDCVGMTTQEEAMQCCRAMRCSSHGHHGEDCCKTMPKTQAPFVQPSSAHALSFSFVFLAAVPANGESHALECPARSISVHCHAPPTFSSQAPSPIRI